MKIIIETIPHSKQRYDTCGDYWIDPDGTWQIRISELNNWKKEISAGIHELAEMAITKHNGCPEQLITAFDKEFEKNRPKGNFDEPGDDPNSPYRNEHCIATAIERIMVKELGLSWKEYSDTIDMLF